MNLEKELLITMGEERRGKVGDTWRLGPGPIRSSPARVGVIRTCDVCREGCGEGEAGGGWEVPVMGNRESNGVS